MTPLEYHRPTSMAEAIDLLAAGIPLAGGTALTPRRLQLHALVDLQELGLDGIHADDQTLKIGAAARLQALVEHEAVPSALTVACMQEAGWNLRNAATLGGSIMAAGGRSPLLTVLLALDVEVVTEPGEERLSLEEVLNRRSAPDRRWLMTEARLPRPAYLGYEQVGRAPADRPIVCAAVARLLDGPGGTRFRVCLGGWGERPVRVLEAESALGQNEGPEAAAKAASHAFAGAGDAWASAAYRAEIAAVLVRRLSGEAVQS